ncbi:xanthine dehydrogenase family protein molybdopterin-binding subunit [Microbacteriaceae bacterium K1510]|nr:xanthine dehydrogenase family protein molybdopterin-binding subunit [Microbacteriaceae bacterium K1510]
MSKLSSDGWIGARLLRKEDARHLLGAAEFVGDIRLPGMQDVAFLRSEVAHGVIRSIRKLEDAATKIFTRSDLDFVKILEAGPELTAFRSSPYPPLAEGKVRYAGQAIAACIASTRARAEDLCERIEVDIEQLPAVVDCRAAMEPGSARLFDHWADNAYIRSAVNEGDPRSLVDAPLRLHRQFRMNRQATVHLEGRGVIAHWDARLDELVIHLSTQGPHVMRLGLARALGLPEHKIRIIAPDVGGGFGGKNRLMPEEVAVAAIAMKVKHPVRWLEDRREHFISSVHARDHLYDLTISADRSGVLLGIEGTVYIDAGAYALWPTGGFMEASMAARNLPGPYRIRHLAIDTLTVATNKPPLGPYRGVARPGACFAIERLVDEVAHELGREPAEIRKLNMVSSAELPYRTAGGLLLDTGDYHESLKQAVDVIDLAAIRARQKEGEPDGRVLGVGFAFYSEQSGHGTVEWSKRKSRVIPGYESARVRVLPDGSVVIHVGVQNHGQGHETSLAQIAAQELGLDPASISIRYGDTATAPFGFGSFASRSIVFAGGAVAKSCRVIAEKVKRIGAHLLQANVGDVRLENGFVTAAAGRVSLAEIATAATIRQEQLPEGMDPLLENVSTYEPSDSGGVFSYGTHAVVVKVDPETGETEIERYVVAEDCGTMINPMIVDGQVQGGIAQGIGTALFEEIPYSDIGQPLATTFADYMVPCATEIPSVQIEHSVTPAKVTEYGVKGVGEGGAIAPPAAVANAIADAFRDIRAQMTETPLTPRRVSDAVALAQRCRKSQP